jgi:septal ring factor EnvC (AmiA/AmiB activator)
MTHEERFGRLEQKLEFLAGNQAQLWADLQELQQISRRHSEQIGQHSAQIAELGSLILRLARVVEEQGRQTERRIAKEAQQRREEVRRRDEESRRIDERLNVLIHIVERYFSNGRKDQP